MSRTVLISGGAKGIGRAIGLRLAEEGWSVAFCYRTSEAAAQETAKAIEAKGAKALFVQCDVSDPEAAAELVRGVEKEFGGVDALINCAGPYRRAKLLDETPEGWNEMFDNNLHPVFYLARAAAPGMRERKWGRIVTFAMAKADQLIAQPNLTAHYLSKVGVLALTRTLAKLLAPDGVTANCVSPGFLDSGSAPQEELDRMVKTIPAGFVGDTADAAGLVRFLLSDEARYVNGANIVVSGAWGV